MKQILSRAKIIIRLNSQKFVNFAFIDHLIINRKIIDSTMQKFREFSKK